MAFPPKFNWMKCWSGFWYFPLTFPVTPTPPPVMLLFIIYFIVVTAFMFSIPREMISSPV